jgi:hypothetical protein
LKSHCKKQNLKDEDSFRSNIAKRAIIVIILMTATQVITTTYLIYMLTDEQTDENFVKSVEITKKNTKSDDKIDKNVKSVLQITLLDVIVVVAAIKSRQTMKNSSSSLCRDDCMRNHMTAKPFLGTLLTRTYQLSTIEKLELLCCKILS